MVELTGDHLTHRILDVDVGGYLPALYLKRADQANARTMSLIQQSRVCSSRATTPMTGNFPSDGLEGIGMSSLPMGLFSPVGAALTLCPDPAVDFDRETGQW